MDTQIRTEQGIDIITLHGHLDTRSSPAVQAAVLPRVTAKGKMILDLREVSYMSSAGLRVLLSLYRHTSNQQGALVLVGVSEEIRDTMEITGFWNFFTACASMDEALRILGSESA
ncbi:STAS domain-containing protein [Haliangium ochraceum]|uniref:Anti-sigma factor antagonist n=1 Tax=Haliangium ochraceum (strain DSM 14365 / JCM 11303 / SMP-2) TaxID=502025 RepID=D0LNN2_HALO1|nr:STAS domain-containing protein [Haliangium ochraceum]ACY16937.1 anti-sigma-factor antagonist [Haliangium ochraceum DSM 14365]